MRRLTDNVLRLINDQIELSGKTVLEIGCGNGAKTLALAQKVAKIYAIDPDQAKIMEARRSYAIENITYAIGSAENLDFKDSSYDIVIFSLSLHHVPVAKLEQAVAEAERVLRAHGHIVFVEPGFTGSFYEAENKFGISDDDERLVKAQAYVTLLKIKNIHEAMEVYGDVTLHFDSIEDFLQTMEPSRNKNEIPLFLEAHDFELEAHPRINIFQSV